jgi:glycosyltransferase involved in cell wall biosynthesis
MKLLILTRSFYPHVGGVEKHVYEVSKALSAKGHKVKVVSEADIKYRHIKFIGLFSIWVWIFKNRKLIETADVVHCHDVFIWYLPFRFIYPKKKIITTIHGFEWDNPLSKISLWQKRLAINLSNKSIGVGDFLEKYLGKKFSLIIYGASDINDNRTFSDKKRIIYVGRLEENTGLFKYLKWLDNNSRYKVDFCGNGTLRRECEKYGTVHGFCDPIPFYKKAQIVVPGGYLAALEALNYGCEIKLFWNNKLKEDYWKMSPFWKLKGDKLKKWARAQTWEKLANEYLDLYKFSK